MSKKKKKKQGKRQRKQASGSTPSFSWVDEEGLHLLAPGVEPTKEFMDLVTENFQKEIKGSSIWEEMVKEHGKEKAEELLKEFRTELK